MPVKVQGPLEVRLLNRVRMQGCNCGDCYGRRICQVLGAIEAEGSFRKLLTLGQPFGRLPCHSALQPRRVEVDAEERPGESPGGRFNESAADKSGAFRGESTVKVVGIDDKDRIWQSAALAQRLLARTCDHCGGRVPGGAEGSNETSGFPGITTRPEVRHNNWRFLASQPRSCKLRNHATYVANEWVDKNDGEAPSFISRGFVDCCGKRLVIDVG